MSEVIDFNEATGALRAAKEINKKVESGAITSLAAVTIEDGEVNFVIDAWYGSELELLGALEILKNAILNSEDVCSSGAA